MNRNWLFHFKLRLGRVVPRTPRWFADEINLTPFIPIHRSDNRWLPLRRQSTYG